MYAVSLVNDNNCRGSETNTTIYDESKHLSSDYNCIFYIYEAKKTFSFRENEIQFR